MSVKGYGVLLFDLDGTLLRSDKRISARTLSVNECCRKRGLLLGVSTSRSEKNSAGFIRELAPDMVISSGKISGLGLCSFFGGKLV